MTRESYIPITPRLEEALDEIKGLIRGRHPEATFAIGQGEDPDGIYLFATVDVDDRGEVIDLYIDRLVDLQVEEGLPLFIIPRRTPERNAAILAQQGSVGSMLLPL
jgi:hypothetical protein